MQESYKNQMVKSDVVISAGYLSIMNNYQKYFEVIATKTMKSISDF